MRILSKVFHICFKSCDISFVLFNLLREVPQEIIFQTVLLTLVVGFHQLQSGHVNIQVHFLLDALIACTQSLDFRIAECGFINIIAGTDRRFACHNLTDKLLFVFKGLPEVRIEGRFGNITVNVNFRIHVALSDDTTAALLQVARSPGCVEVVECDQPVLYVHAGSHLKGRTHENTDLTGTDFAEQFLFTNLGVCLMDERNLLSRNPSCHKFFPDVIVHGEARFFRGTVFLCKHFKSTDFRAVEVACRSFGHPLACRTFRSGEITENELGQFIVLSFLPNAVNVIYAHIDFACRLIGKIRIDDTLVKAELTTVRGNAKHIVYGRVNLTRMDGGCSLGKLLHHRLLDFCRLRHLIVIDGSRGREIELICGFNISRFFEQVHQLRQIKELGKSGSRPVSCSFGRKLNGGRGLSKGRCPTVKVSQSLIPNRVVLQVSHHRVQLGHGIADGGSRCKYNATAIGYFIDVAAFQEHIRRLLRIAGRKPRHIPHFCVEEQILKTVCLVNIEAVNAELFKGNHIVFAGAVLQFLQTGFQALFCSLQ